MPRAPRKQTAAANRQDPTSTRGRGQANAASQQTRNADLEAITAGQSNGAEGSARDLTSVTNYLLMCSLTSSEDPMIQRILSVPGYCNFDNLHLVMQAAFGWANQHAWQFDVRGKRNDEPEDNAESRPAFPRLIYSISPMSKTMKASFADESEKYKEGSELTLADVLEDPSYQGDVEIEYTYDMGDNWTHMIHVLGKEHPALRGFVMGPAPIEEQQGWAVCMSGEGHPCAEDCGSEPGWMHLKELFAKPRSRDEDGLKEWYKNVCANGDPKGLDPFKWDKFEVNDRLKEIKI